MRIPGIRIECLIAILRQNATTCSLAPEGWQIRTKSYPLTAHSGGRYEQGQSNCNVPRPGIESGSPDPKARIIIHTARPIVQTGDPGADALSDGPISTSSGFTLDSWVDTIHLPPPDRTKFQQCKSANFLVMVEERPSTIHCQLFPQKTAFCS